MKKGLTEIVFLLDCSGSMYGLTADTIGGYNSMLEEQRALPGECIVSTVLFNGESRVLHDRVPVARVAPMTGRDYRASGCTALLDAMGGALHHIGMVHRYAREEDRPEKTIVVITTDGMENASRNYRIEKVRKMVAERREKYGWEFIFLGANIDAVSVAEDYGIGAETSMEFRATPRGVRANYEAVSCAVATMRGTGELGDSWRGRIEEAFREEDE